jgi:hypothetical protein
VFVPGEGGTYGSTSPALLPERIIVGRVDAAVRSSGFGGGVETGFCSSLATSFIPEKIIVGMVDAAVSSSGFGSGVETGFCNNPGALPVLERINVWEDAVVRISGCGGVKAFFCGNLGTIVVGAVDASVNASGCGGCGGSADSNTGVAFRDTSGILRPDIRMVESSSAAAGTVDVGSTCKEAPHRVQNLGSRAPRSTLQNVQNMNTCH